MKYHVYIDYTTEHNPRPYYVGKGNEGRVRFPDRNGRHKHRRKHLGLVRVVVYETFDEGAAFDVEKSLVAEHHTWIHDPLCTIGTNYTQGGEGCSGLVHTNKTKKKIRAARERQTREGKLRVQNIAQYDLDGNFIKLYTSITEAKRSVNVGVIRPRNFTDTRSNKYRRTAGGFMWLWVEKGTTPPEKIEPFVGYIRNQYAVVQIDLETGKDVAVFKSISEAYRQTDIHGCVIQNWCLGRQSKNHKQKFGWRYLNGTPECKANKDYVRGTKTPVQQFDLDGNLLNTYESVNDAYRKTGVASIAIKCRGLVKDKNYIWRYVQHDTTSDIVETS